ncbi:MAG: tetratricopeptide repeat protein [Planctomycetes bacterium]|nr:tetratricopeptide repeat protein [Planctomycetota bacterium]
MSDEVKKIRSALELYQQGEYTRAEMLLESIFPEHLPDDLQLEASYLHGLILVRRGDPLEAAVKFQACVRLDSSFYPALDAWGNVLSRLGDFRGAIEKFKRAESVATPEQLPHVLVNRGKILLDAGYHFKALKVFWRAAKLDKSSSDANYFTGQCLLKLDRPKAALIWMRRARKLDQPSARNEVGYGIALAQNSRPNSAQKAYRRALKIDQMSVEGWLNLSILFSKAGEFSKAIKVCKQGQTKLHGAFELLAQQLFCLRQMGAYDAALEVGEHAVNSLEFAVGSPRAGQFEDLASANMAGCSRANGDMKSALRILTTYLHKSRSAAVYTLAELRWTRGVALRAGRIHEITITVRPEDQRAYQRTYWVVAKSKKQALEMAFDCEPPVGIEVAEYSVSARPYANVDGGVIERTPAIPLDS